MRASRPAMLVSTSSSVFPKCDGLEQLLEGDAGLFLHRPRIGLVLLADADGVDDDEVIFARSVGRDGL